MKKEKRTRGAGMSWNTNNKKDELLRKYCESKDPMGTMLSDLIKLKKQNEKLKNTELALELEIDRLKKENEKLKECVMRMASLQKPNHEKKEYWFDLTKEECAIVLATDTKIARQCLKELEEQE